MHLKTFLAPVEPPLHVVVLIEASRTKNPYKQQSAKMPPKRITVEQGGSYRQKAPQGVLKSTYSALTSPENASVVRSIAMFAVCCPRTAPGQPLTDLLPQGAEIGRAHV